MTDGDLSKDREHIAGRQRQRRARMARIDYYPSPDALAWIESRRTRYGPTNNNSGILDTIIAEWAVLAGLQQSELDKLKSPAKPPELCDQYARMRMTSTSRNRTRAGTTSAVPELSDTSRACAGARVSSASPECLPPSQARAGANDFDPRQPKPAHPPKPDTPEFLTAFARANDYGLCHATLAGAQANKSGGLPDAANQARATCGARRRRDGQPCQALRVPGKRRCKWHGGASTGPRTVQGQIRSKENLRQYSKMIGTTSAQYTSVSTLKELK
jgi:hypothetical protein